ncbi:MAG: hypothetical protein AUJ37_02455 [Candidatus Magasanikbacteria bacterium CG1_02_41_34]|nr:MAG: hypothetical protein AUJ37_02455 [Candidatus Magasanikbacteria bacterium CG1_02_41_34]
MKEKPEFLYEADPWMLGENIPNCDLFFSTIWLEGFVSYFRKHAGRPYKKLLCRYEGYNLWFYFGEQDAYDVAEIVAEKILYQEGFAQEVNKHICIDSDILRTFCEKIPQKHLDQLSNEELWYYYETHQKIHSAYYEWAWIPVCVDMFHGNLTKKVKEYLHTKGVSEEKVNEYFVVLTQPVNKSLIILEQEELLAIAIAIEHVAILAQIFKDGNIERIQMTLKDHSDILEMLHAHTNKYYYTKHLWVTGEYTIEDYIQQLVDIFATGEKPSEILKKQDASFVRAKEERDALVEQLQIEEKWKKILYAYGEFMVTKIYRRYAQIFAVHHMSAILKEIAKRKYLTEMQVRFATLYDIEKMLLHDEYNAEELLERTKHCVYYAEEGYSHVYIKEESSSLEKEVEQEIVDEDITELHGETGCLGYGKGPVKIIIRAEDMAKMNPGDVLVSIATDPDIVPAMKKACAIVTEQGGVTSHAAIVSRELGIPCVIGTKIATKVLKDGDMVEVDANRGIVKKLT